MTGCDTPSHLQDIAPLLEHCKGKPVESRVHKIKNGTASKADEAIVYTTLLNRVLIDESTGKTHFSSLKPLLYQLLGQYIWKPVTP